MSEQKKDQKKLDSDSSPVGEFPQKPDGAYEQGREEAIEDVEGRRIWEEKEGVEENIRDHEVRGGHLHTPYFEYDNPSYEDKEVFFKGGSNKDKKIKADSKKNVEAKSPREKVVDEIKKVAEKIKEKI
ncbi:MAG TPA: hypothetical protein VK536_10830 [Candidatus Limnocylindrales bacterium]|nr:hypothetical protein [Candidatus Limnocylindrales bacterium]